jgi:hypothetical protein
MWLHYQSEFVVKLSMKIFLFYILIQNIGISLSKCVSWTIKLHVYSISTIAITAENEIKTHFINLFTYEAST